MSRAIWLGLTIKSSFVKVLISLSLEPLALTDLDTWEHFAFEFFIKPQATHRGCVCIFIYMYMEMCVLVYENNMKVR